MSTQGQDLHDSRSEVPRGVRVEEAGAAGAPLIIVRRWFPSDIAFTSFWCAAWNVVLAIACWKAFADGDFETLLVPGIIPAAASAFLTYRLFALLLNSTTFRLDERALTVRHGPLPWLGARTIPVTDVRQLFVRAQPRSGPVFGPFKSSYAPWQLCAKTSTAVVSLATDLELPQAEYVEWAIEDRIGIQDDPHANLP